MSGDSATASSILRNIFEFVKILNCASHQIVASWTEESLKNALDWAGYCQELHTQIKGQNYEQDINRQLCQMVVFLEPVSCLALSIDSLGYAQALLLESLLSNPSFPSSLQERLSQMLPSSPDGLKVLEQVQLKLSESQRCLQVHTGVLATLTGGRGCDHLPDLAGSYQARVLLENMVAAVEHIRRMERVEKYCQDVYNKLSQTAQGWNILVQVFAVDAGSLFPDRDSHRDRILACFLRRITEELQQDVGASQLWNIPVDQLIRASCVSQGFFLTYLDALLSLGDACQPYVEHSGLVVWRSHHLTLQDLSRHFQQLLASSSHERQQKILEEVTGRVRGTEFTAWHELVRSLISVFKHGMVKIRDNT